MQWTATGIPSGPLDDGCLEDLAPELRNLQPHLARRRLQLPIVAARPRVLAGLAALVSCRTHQPVGLGIQKRVQRLLNAPAHHMLQGA